MKTLLGLLALVILSTPFVNSYIQNQVGEYDIENYLMQEVALVELERPNQFGKASWYDYKLLGVPNYSQTHGTAASKDFLRGADLKVCRTIPVYYQEEGIQDKPIDVGSYQKCVEVYVNDYVVNPDVVIDLSSFAFSQLADLKLGIIEVEIYEL